MVVENSHFIVQRQTSLSSEEKEEFGWYFYANRHWYEYGTQSSTGERSSVNSSDIEQEYNRSPQGIFYFTAGSFYYSIDFTAMIQKNLTTEMTRRIRRRPKFNCIIKGKASQMTSVNQLQPLNSPPSAGEDWKWQFLGNDAEWIDYSLTECSLSSEAIEKLYHQHAQNQVKFTAGRFTYTLDFAGMCQTNDITGTKRLVRRIANSSDRCQWQFNDVGGLWRDFSRGSCSVSSEDIEAAYQQDSSGTMNFIAGRFTYELNFSAMTQKNLLTNTVRAVRRQQQ